MEHFSKHLIIKPTGDELNWIVKSIKDDEELGIIHWHRPWKKFVFEPDAWTIYDADCLREIRNFLRQINSPEPKEQLKSFMED